MLPCGTPLLLYLGENLRVQVMSWISPGLKTQMRSQWTHTAHNVPSKVLCRLQEEERTLKLCETVSLKRDKTEFHSTNRHIVWRWIKRTQTQCLYNRRTLWLPRVSLRPWVCVVCVGEGLCNSCLTFLCVCLHTFLFPNCESSHEILVRCILLNLQNNS